MVRTVVTDSRKASESGAPAPVPECSARPLEPPVPPRPHPRTANGEDHDGRGRLLRRGGLVAHQRPTDPRAADRAAGRAADHVRDRRARPRAHRQRGGRSAGRRRVRARGRADLVELGRGRRGLSHRRPAAAPRPAPARGGDQRDAGARRRRRRVRRARARGRDADRCGHRCRHQPRDRAAALHPAHPRRDQRTRRPHGRLRPRPRREPAWRVDQGGRRQGPRPGP